MPETIESYLKGRERQLAMARLQDAVVAAIYEIDKDIILHGGTAIWRCYNGNRFSEDVDFYLTDEQVKRFNHELTWALRRHGAVMEYPKISIRVVEAFNDFARVKLEGMRQEGKRHPIQKEYERVDGSKFFITTLPIEEFILEKITAYSRRAYGRDLYDIYHLTSIEKPTQKARKALREFLKDIKKPIDESKLKDIVYVGITPSFETMLEAIRGKLE